MRRTSSSTRATDDEINGFESGYLSDWEEALMADPTDDAARARADQHRRGWLHGYRSVFRSVFGWTYRTLGRPVAGSIP